MPHAVHREEGEVQDIPFLRNDIKNEAPTMDRQLDARMHLVEPAPR